MRIVLVLILLSISTAFAIEKPGEQLPDLSLKTELGAPVDLSLTFTDSTGEKAALSDFVLSGKPNIIVPAYYNCPRLCGLLLSGMVDLFNELELKIGKDFNVLTVSFNPKEGSELAAKRKSQYLEKLRSHQDAAASGWHFLSGSKENIDLLMQQIGFPFLEDKGEYAHTAAFMILTPDGRISQYFGNIKFRAFDTKLALVEASDGGIGSALDHVLLFCFRFDPLKGKYTWAAFGVMRTGGVLTLLLLGGRIFRLWRKERQSSSPSSDA